MGTGKVVAEAVTEQPTAKEPIKMPAEWEQKMIALMRNMIGPHPRMAIIYWDGSAFQFREAKPPQRVTIRE